jgi:hypothetical protein
MSEFAGTIQPTQPLHDTWKWGDFRPKNGARQIDASFDHLSGDYNLTGLGIPYNFQPILLSSAIFWTETRVQQNQVGCDVPAVSIGNRPVNHPGTVYCVADDERSSRHVEGRSCQALKHLLVFGQYTLSSIRILRRPIWLAIKQFGCHSSLTKHAFFVRSLDVRQLENEIRGSLVAVSAAPFA